MGTAPCPECGTSSAPQAEAVEQPSVLWHELDCREDEFFLTRPAALQPPKLRARFLGLLWDGLHRNKKYIMENQLNSQSYGFSLDSIVPF